MWYPRQEATHNHARILPTKWELPLARYWSPTLRSSLWTRPPAFDLDRSFGDLQKTRVVRFASAATILETFGLPKDGQYYKRLIAGFERIFYSTFYFTSDQREGETVIITRTSFRFVRDLKLWYIEKGKQPSDSRHENVIVLSEEFWKEIQDHPVPVDLSVVKALADSPGNLDFYIWLVWRCWTAKGRVCIPLFGPAGLVQQLGLSNNLRDRDFTRR